MTVAELIAKLQTFPADKYVAISDPDTGWCVFEIDIGEDSDWVTFHGEYRRMSSDWDEALKIVKGEREDDPKRDYAI